MFSTLNWAADSAKQQRKTRGALQDERRRGHRIWDNAGRDRNGSARIKFAGGMPFGYAQDKPALRGKT